MKKLLAELFAKTKKEKPNRHTAVKDAPRRTFPGFHFRSIRARGMVVGSGLVLLAILVALAAYALSLQAYY